jgi:hypothetical protein
MTTVSSYYTIIIPKYVKYLGIEICKRYGSHTKYM